MADVALALMCYALAARSLGTDRISFVLAQAGSTSATELISMAERTVAALQPSAAAGHADALFSFLQQALDVRRSAPALDAQQIERAAITALVALVMKLSERQFKPLFLRLHAWSTTHPVGQPGGLPSAWLCVSLISSRVISAL